MPNEVITTLISSLVGGLLVAIVSHFLTRKKTEAETEKFKAEADKIRAEAEKARAETTKLMSEVERLNVSVEDANYNRANVKETVLYDSKKGIFGTDFEGLSGVIPGDEKREIGHGAVRVDHGTLIIERTNASGSFIVYLRRYSINGKEKDYIPKNEGVEGSRKLRFSCEAKVTRGACTLHIVIGENLTNKILESKMLSFAQEKWSKIDLVFRISPSSDCYLQIHHSNIPQPSNLLLRNMFLADRSD
ncbi:MAG TPA: hypothetical protein VN643_17740 [Pyrinomonadaceae bacterium]|nr:hypothetical protein [Pyrinomonadaceae bacterium]